MSGQEFGEDTRRFECSGTGESVVKGKTLAVVSVATVFTLIYAQETFGFVESHLPSSQLGSDLLWFIWTVLLVAPLFTTGVYAITRPKEPEGPKEIDIPFETPPELSDLPEEAQVPFQVASQGLTDNASEALKRGIKIGLELAAKGGVEYSVTAVDSTELDLDGLKIRIVGTGKAIPTDEMVKIIP